MTAVLDVVPKLRRCDALAFLAIEVVLPLPGSRGQFTKLASAVAATAKKIKAKEWDNPTKGLIELRLPDGTVMAFDTKNEIVTVRCAGIDGCPSMVAHLDGDQLRQVMGA
jgi:hypothetical protein